MSLNHPIPHLPIHPAPEVTLTATGIPHYDSLARWLHALWLEHPKRRAKVPSFFALTFWRGGGLSLRVVTLANGWYILLEQISPTQYIARAECSDASALYQWICRHFPDEAYLSRWRPEPWPYWRQNDLPTQTGDIL